MNTFDPSTLPATGTITYRTVSVVDAAAAHFLEVRPDAEVTAGAARAYWNLLSTEQRAAFDDEGDFHVCLEMRVDDLRKALA